MGKHGPIDATSLTVYGADMPKVGERGPEPNWRRSRPIEALEGRLRVQLWYTDIDGRQELVGISANVVGRGERLEIRDLHAVRIGELADEHRPDLLPSDDDEALLRAIIHRPGRRGGRPQVYPDQHWKDVAATYRATRSRSFWSSRG